MATKTAGLMYITDSMLACCPHSPEQRCPSTHSQQTPLVTPRQNLPTCLRIAATRPPVSAVLSVLSLSGEHSLVGPNHAAISRVDVHPTSCWTAPQPHLTKPHLATPLCCLQMTPSRSRLPRTSMASHLTSWNVSAGRCQLCYCCAAAVTACTIAGV